MMSVEKNLSEQFNQYKREEAELEQYRQNKFRSHVKIVLSTIFEAHYAGLISALVWLCTLISKHDATGGGVICCAVFIGAGILVWIFIGNYYWFKGEDYSWSPPAWLSSISDFFCDLHNSYEKVNTLNKSAKKREEFFKFYELYKNDEQFRESYNAQLSPETERNEFLKKLNKDNDK